ncbi:MAG: Gfo/Idh/MocA family oxidoreductase [Chloroflexi bacterium]|nr:Gfo/Idh/MocA family oxidoreductase [Chloroflexota bacterium]
MINFGVVGYGYSGRAFHTYLPTLADGLNLRAIAVRNPAVRQQAAADHPEARVYADLDTLLADGAIQLVILATPHDTHRDLAIQAMEAGKHVVTDKVMALNAHQAEEMIAAARRNDVMLSVFHNRRWDWDYLTVQKVVSDGLLGEPFLFHAAVAGYGAPRGWRGDRAKSGGIMYDWGAHFMDQALQLVPAPVESVFCDIIYRPALPTDIGNYGLIRMQFANGTRYSVEITNLSGIQKPRWFVQGDKGSLIKYGLDPQEDAMRQKRIEEAEEDPANYARLVTYRNGEQSEQVIPSVRGSWVSYYQNISDVLNKGAELAVKPEQVLDVMRVYDAAMRSAETGQVVRL